MVDMQIVAPNVAAEQPLETTIGGNEKTVTNVAKRAGRSPGPTNRAKSTTTPLEEKVSPAELRTRLAHVLNTVAMFVRSSARFDDEDMDNVSKGIIDIINMFPSARVIVRILGPLSVIGDMAAKVRYIVESRTSEKGEGGAVRNGGTNKPVI